MIKSWEDVKVRDLMKIKEIEALQTKSVEEKNLLTGAYLSNMTYDEFIQLPLDKAKEYMDLALFLTEKPKLPKIRNKYVINGQEYILLKGSEDLTVAQYIDFETIAADGFDKHIPELLAIFLVPEGHSYNDGYDKDRAIEDMGDMQIVEGLSIANFFTKRYIKLTQRLMIYLKLRMKWLRMTTRKKDRERMRAIELEMNLIMEELNSMCGLIVSEQ